MPHASPIATSTKMDFQYWHPARPITKVAVIGSGAAGMPAAKHLRDNGIQVRVFERNAYPGGIWKYHSAKRPAPQFPALDRHVTDVPSTVVGTYPSSSFRVYSGPEAEAKARAELLAFAPPGPAYETLKNNIPSPIMSFQGRPRPAIEPRDWYHLHTQHQAYLESYAAEMKLEPMTSFGTRVEKADCLETGQWRLWMQSLKIEQTASEEWVVHVSHSTEDFDAIVAATGHHNAPATPDIDGLRDWQAIWPDRLSHALSFRKGSDWLGRKKVLVVGSGPSGSDMAREISSYADEVFVTTRPFEDDDSPDTKIVKQVFRDRLSATCTLVPTVRRFMPLSCPDAAIGQVELIDGTIIEVDSVLFATGYYHSYPFLKDFEARMADDDSTRLVHGQYTVLNLHQDLFYIPNPTLVCLGVPANISAFSFFEYQALEVARVWSGRAQLPSIPKMAAAYAARRAAISDRNLHVYGKVLEPRMVEDIAAFLNSEATRLGCRDHEAVTGYPADYMAVKARTVEGLLVRDQVEDERLIRTRRALCSSVPTEQVIFTARDR